MSQEVTWEGIKKMLDFLSYTGPLRDFEGVQGGKGNLYDRREGRVATQWATVILQRRRTPRAPRLALTILLKTKCFFCLSDKTRPPDPLNSSLIFLTYFL